MGTFLRLVRDDSGQDVIEYALLTAFIGLAGISVFELLRTTIGTTYGSWNTNANNLSLTPNPGN